MGVPYRSREQIAEELISLHKAGVRITAEGLKKDHSSLNSAIFYKWKGKPKYFKSIKEARELAANYLEEKNDLKTAKEIRKYNGKRVSPTKFTEEQNERRKKELIIKLKEKIEAKEDVSYRFQQAVDRPFVSKCRYAFGQYKKAFSAAGLNYKDHARHIKKTKKDYLNELIELICSGKDLDRTSVDQYDQTLLERLNHFYNGYYNALRLAKRELERQGKKKLALTVDIHYWQKKRDIETIIKSETKKAEGFDKIKKIEKGKEYDAGKLDILLIGKHKAEYIIKTVRESDNWLNSVQMSRKIGCTESNLFKNVMHKFPEKVLHYLNRGQRQYFFHKSLLNKYKKTNVSTRSPPNSINYLANKFGVNYSKIRGIVERLGLEFKIVKRTKIFTPESVQIIRKMQGKGLSLTNVFAGFEPPNPLRD